MTRRAAMFVKERAHVGAELPADPRGKREEERAIREIGEIAESLIGGDPR
ncbi:MAG: hypothetical protein ACRD09_01190 [Vicinamibacterales bacterium]